MSTAGLAVYKLKSDVTKITHQIVLVPTCTCNVPKTGQIMHGMEEFKQFLRTTHLDIVR